MTVENACRKCALTKNLKLAHYICTEMAVNAIKHLAPSIRFIPFAEQYDCGQNEWSRYHC